MSNYTPVLVEEESKPAARIIAAAGNAGAVWVLRLLVVAGVLYHALLVTRPDAFFVTRPFIEDAFYSLSVARSLAEGHGLTIDGIQRTNGVQPLVCFTYAPMFALAGGDTTLALRLVMAQQVIFYALAALAVAWFVVTLLKDQRRRREVFWLVAVFAIWNYSLSTSVLNGLETGLAMAMAFFSAAFYNERIAPLGRRRLGKFFLLGLMLGIAVLTRIDLAILVVSLIAWHLRRAHVAGRDLAGTARGRAFVRTLVECAIIGGVSFLVSAPWWAYNYFNFGSLVPISGQAQQLLFHDRWHSLGYSLEILSNAFMLVVHVPNEMEGVVRYSGIILAAVAAGTLLMFAEARVRLAEAWRIWRSLFKPAWATPVAAFAVTLFVYYTFFFGAPHFLFRYLISLWMLVVLAIVTFLWALWNTAAPRSRMRQGLACIAALCVLASGAAMVRNFASDGLYFNIFRYPADWIEANAKPTDRIGMFQSGTTGFLFPSVTNLDGKVNFRALRAMQSGTVPAYVDSMGFDYIIDWDFYTRHVFSDAAVRSRYVPIDTLPREFVVWKRVR